MKIITPSFEILNPTNKEQGIAALRFVESMARISHKSEDRQTEDSWERFINFVVVQHADWSVCEHSLATVLFTLDRATANQLVRHRLFGFTQASTRFINFKKVGEIEVIRPPGLKSEDETVWLESVSKACWGYTVLMERKYAPETARSVLPLCLATKIAVSGNYRNWRHFLISRTTKETQQDFKNITIPLLAAFKERVPIIFDDIQPDEKQSVAFSKPR
jgi:thymidylate synthase (FAD)